MTKERRQQVMLAVLIGVLVLVGGRMILSSGGGDGVTTTSSGEAGDGFAIGKVDSLRIAALDLEPEIFELGRDPFRYVTAPERPKPQPERQPPVQRQPPTRQPQPARQAGPPAPQPPPVDVVYLGRFGPTNRPIAVFSDGQEIFNALEGGVLKGNFVVDKIGYESADLKFVGFPDTPSERLAVGG